VQIFHCIVLYCIVLSTAVKGTKHKAYGTELEKICLPSADVLRDHPPDVWAQM